MNFRKISRSEFRSCSGKELEVSALTFSFSSIGVETASTSMKDADADMDILEAILMAIPVVWPVAWYCSKTVRKRYRIWKQGQDRGPFVYFVEDAEMERLRRAHG